MATRQQTWRPSVTARSVLMVMAKDLRPMLIGALTYWMGGEHMGAVIAGSIAPSALESLSSAAASATASGLLAGWWGMLAVPAAKVLLLRKLIQSCEVRLTDTDTGDCPICREDSCDCRTECGHTFHRSCLGEWLERSDTCPSCRTVLPGLLAPTDL